MADKNRRMPPPRSLGEFSLDKDQIIRFDRSNARYLYKKPTTQSHVNINLNRGYEHFDVEDSRTTPAEEYHAICRWAVDFTKAGTHVKTALSGADFICSSEILAKITASPYKIGGPWEFAAMKMHGMVFITERHRSWENVAEGSRATFWNHKFKQCMRTVSKQGVPKTRGPVGRDEYRAAVLGFIQAPKTDPHPNCHLRMLICGEVDCIEEDGSLVALKTYAHSLDRNFWRNEARDTYIRCRLLGIRHVVIGLRTSDGHVKQVIRMSAENILERGKPYWDFGECVTYLHSVITTVQSSLKDGETCNFKLNRYPVLTKSQNVPWTEFGYLTDEFRAHFGIY